MKKLVISISFSFFLYCIVFISKVSAQDIITLKNGDEITCKIISITGNDVSFKNYSNLEGPLYIKKKYEIFMIKYENGEKEVFDVIEQSTLSSNEDSKFNEFTDERDGQKYKSVKIGEQVWMAENLNFDMQGSGCPNGNCEKYGRLYNYYSALEACPVGWHLPSDEEFQELEIALGMPFHQASKEDWRGVSPGQGAMMKKGGSSGMNVIFAGFCTDNYNKITDLDVAARIWTATKFKKNAAYGREIGKRASIYRAPFYKKLSHSVRCVKN